MRKLPTKTARKIDPLKYALQEIRADAGQYLARVNKIIAKWPLVGRA